MPECGTGAKEDISPLHNQGKGNDVEKASEDVDLAISIMSQCKAELLRARHIDTAILWFHEVLEKRPTTHPFHHESVNNLASALGVRFMYTNRLRHFEESLTLRGKKTEIFLDDHDIKKTDFTFSQQDDFQTQEMEKAAKKVLSNFQKLAPLDAINTIVFLLKTSLAFLPAAHPRQSSALTTLAQGLYFRFHHLYDISDLKDALTSLHGVSQSWAQTDQQHTNTYHSVCALLAAHSDFPGTSDVLDLQMDLLPPPNINFKGTGTADGGTELLDFANRLCESSNMTNINNAIALIRKGITALSVSSGEYVVALNDLAIALWTRFEHGGQRNDLNEALSLHRQALELQPLPHPDRSTSINNLACTLATKFENVGQREDINESISLHRQALELRPLPNPDRSTSLNNLASALALRFELGDHAKDLDEAISFHRQALELRFTHNRQRYSSLTNLANGLWTRFDQKGQVEDLDEAIFLHRQALELLPKPHPDRFTSLNQLASALSIRFEKQGQANDIDEALSLYLQAPKGLSTKDPRQYICLNNIANVRWTRYQHRRQVKDLDDAINSRRQALEYQEYEPIYHPELPMSLNQLANALSIRFEQGGRARDINESVSLHRRALELQPLLHLDRPSFLNGLASALTIRSEQGRHTKDLDEAIRLHQEALELVPASSPYRSACLNYLGVTLSIRFEKEGQVKDLDEAISLHRQALELQRLPNSDRATSLHNLASALSIRFEQGRQEQDLNEAISCHQQALELRPSPHPSRSASLYALGNLFIQAQSTNRESSQYLEAAMASFIAAIQCFPRSASQQLRIAKAWSRYADKYHHTSAIEAYDFALQALPRVAALNLDIQLRQELLNSSDGLARDASRCAIRMGNLPKAIEFLEAGRTVFWSQVLALRSPFDQLDDIAPELAQNLRSISEELEIGSHFNVSFGIDNRTNMIHDSGNSQLNRLNEQWIKAIDEVRELKGFNDFFRPRCLSSLQAAALQYPVAILVENDDGSHCLIMTSTDIHHIPLPSLPTRALKELVHLVQVATSQLEISRSSVETVIGNITAHLEEGRGMRYKHDELGSSDDFFKFVLKILWEGVVKPVIDILEIQRSREMPILQWCPTGLFTFLPIHAAGCYDDDLNTECIFDYLISSYTPTIKALLADSPGPAPSTEALKMMVVIQSKELHSTKKELEKIEKHVSSDTLIKLGVPGTPADVDTVASRLSDASIVHFACHGKQDRLNPLNSGLKLDDGLLRVSTIMKERMPNGSLAFLCACETAMGDEKVPDEAMSLGATLIFSGFRRVIATMWEIWDADGPAIADAFYEELFRGPDGKPALEPNINKSARALHVAVSKLRSKKVEFRRWVPFIHMGK